MAELLRDRYELLEVVGQGGEGRVVKALDHQHERVVALKIRTVGSNSDRAELLSEARILLAVPPHEHLPLVREDFFDGDRYVIAMDWVEGTDLGRLLQARGRPGLAPSMVMQWLADAATALTHLHTQDPPVVHGDVKPANLILTRGGRVSLVDFGLSSAPDSPRKRGGTRGYAAPELVVKGRPDRRADIYSLAATAFALLTGAAPTGIRPTWDGIEPDQAHELEEAVRLGLATDPDRRPETPGELVELLRAGWGATLPTGVLTFCFTDIEGSTGMWDAQPADMALALVRHDELIAATVEQHGGRFLESMGEGDSTVSVFTSPAPALDAAIAFTRELSAQTWAGDLDLRARVGIHTGEVEQRNGAYFGSTMNLAARLRGLADGGQVFCSGTTAKLIAGHLPDRVALVDLGPHTLRGLRDPEPVFAVAAPGIEAPPDATECPYPGLLSFGVDDADRFFGREQIVESLVTMLRAHQFVAVVGGSGSGKSSVLRAGLAPAFGAADIITPGEHPLAALDAVTTTKRGTPRRAALKRALIIDQFEELFTLCADDTERSEFLDRLLALDRPVVIGLRADFYGQCSTFPTLATAVAAHQLLLGPMVPDELRRAITEPARLAMLRLEPGLVDVLVGEVAGEPGALPLLSHALRATWEARNGRTLTLDGYHATGGVRGAIATTADHAINGLETADRVVARGLFIRLVEPGEDAEDTRRRARLDELTPPGDSGARVTRVLDLVAAARLVTVDDDGVEVAHEALIREWPTLRAWLDEDREGLRVHRHLTAAAQAWDRMHRDPGELYRGPRLAAAAELAERQRDLSPLEREFVTASTRRAERDVRRLRTILAGVAIALIVALVAGALALVQQHRASRSSRLADVSRIAALSRAVRAKHPDLGLLLAVEANHLHESSATHGALVGALGQNPRMVGTLHGINSGLESAEFSPDGRLLATASFDGTILWDVATRKPVGKPLRDAQHFWVSAVFSPDGSLLATTGEAGMVTVWNVATRTAVRQLADPHLGGLGHLAWSHNGRVIAVSGGGEGNDQTVVWDVASGNLIAPPFSTGQPGECGSARPAFSPDDSLLVSAGRCGEVGVWKLPSLRPAGPALHVTTDPQWNIQTVAIAPNRPLLAIGAQDGEVSMWDLTTRRQVGKTLSVGSVPVNDVVFSAAGDRIAAGSSEGLTFVWDVATGALFGDPLNANAGRINSVAFSPDGHLLATASYDRSGAIWNLDGRQPLGTPLAGTHEWVTATAYSADGRLLATSHSESSSAVPITNGAVTIRRAATMEVLAQVDMHGPVFDVAFVPRGHKLAVGGSDGSIHFLDGDTGRAAGADIAVGNVWVTDIAFSADGRRIAVATDPNAPSHNADPKPNAMVFLFDAATGRPVGRPLEPGTEASVGLAYSPDGKRIAVATDNLQLFDVATNQRVGKPIEVTDSDVAAVAFSPDSTRVASAGFSGLVQVRNPITRKQSVAAMQADAIVSGISYSLDGSVLTTTNLYGHTQFWNPITGEAIGDTLVGGAVPVPSSRFIDLQLPTRSSVSPDGRHLATGGIDGSAMVWDLDPARWSNTACAVAGRNLTRVEWRQYVGTRRYRATCPQWPT